MERRYKFKHFETYTSKECMANNTRKFRTCFEKAELDFVRCELALYNKLFDEEDWQAKLTLLVLGLPKEEELCRIEEKITVSKNENIFYFRDRWGNEQKGSYWKKGSYKWKVFQDDQPVHEHIFHVNNVGWVNSKENPYFDIVSLRLYESDKTGRNTKGKFLKVID